MTGSSLTLSGSGAGSNILIISSLFVVVNIMVDLAYAIIDPRVRLNKIK